MGKRTVYRTARGAETTGATCSDQCSPSTLGTTSVASMMTIDMPKNAIHSPASPNARKDSEVAKLAGESKTGAVRQALRERRDRLELERGGKEKKRRDLRRFMETEIWPLIPEEERGKPPMTKAEREEILGIGPEGY